LGPPTHNVIHIMKDPARSYTYLGDNFAARLAEVDVNGLASAIGTEYRLDSVDITPLDGTSVTRHIARGSSSWPVGESGAEIIPQACALVKLETAVRGRSYRGRIYIGAVGETAQYVFFLDDTPRDNMTAAWVDLANFLVS